MEKKYKKIAVEISRYILGLVFIFSGFVKAVDPWGGAYKIQDYFTAFEFTELNFLSLSLSFFQAAVEFGVGACLLLGIYRRFNAVLVLLIMLFMTPLTLYLAIENPVTDCGCFGDALVITNWQTFYKNLILLIAAIIVFMWYRLMPSCFSRKRYFYPTVWIFLFIVGVSFYCFYYLPVIDFRPYKIGANIPEKMEIPENAEHDVYDVRLIYSKDGKQKEFTINDYPKGDTTWTFIDSQSHLVKKGFQPPIHDFTITTADGEEITQDILTDPSYTFLLISQKLEKAKDTNVDKINDIFDYSKSQKYGFYALTASLPNAIHEWVENTGAEYPFCKMDEITLKTIVRSNPGLLLMKNGTIINKWPNTCLPSANKLNKLIDNADHGKTPTVHNFRTILVLALILVVPLAGFYLYDSSKRRKKKQKSRREGKKL